MRRLPFILLAASVVLPGPCCALEWKQTRIELVAGPCETESVALFEFRNPLDRPVHILEVDATCGCTGVQPGSTEIPPGGESEILVVFHHEGRQGPQEKSIRVVSDDTDSPAHLTLAVDLPVVVRAQPAALNWRIGERRTWKSSAIDVSSDPCFTFEGIEVDRKLFTAKLVTRGNRREVRVRPAVAGPVSTTVLIHVRVGTGGTRRSFPLHVVSGISGVPPEH